MDTNPLIRVNFLLIVEERKFTAALFSCLTGLRISDIIRLQWENIIKGADGGWCMHIVTKKTRTEAVLPLSDEALALCGERSTGQVFKLSLIHI